MPTCINILSRILVLEHNIEHNRLSTAAYSIMGKKISIIGWPLSVAQCKVVTTFKVHVICLQFCYKIYFQAIFNTVKVSSCCVEPLSLYVGRISEIHLGCVATSCQIKN